MSKRIFLLVLFLVLMPAAAGCASEPQAPPPPTEAQFAAEPTLVPPAQDQAAEEPAEVPTTELATEPTAEPVPVDEPTADVEPSPSAGPTETDAPNTEEPPTAEPEIAATTEESETPPAAPVALPAGWYGPPDWPEGMNPLTGELVEDPALLDRRPIAIKVSNYPAVVRPQAGLNNADLIFEHYAEGGSTRFTAVFYGKDAHTVGSVRSARIIDFEIPVMYDAAFGFSGAAGPNKERFSQVEWFDRIVSPDFEHKGFYRAEPKDPDIDFWHLMFTDTYRLREKLQERGQDVAPQYQNGMIFSEEPPPGGTPAEQVEIGFGGSYVTWWFDSGVGRYYRWNDGDRHNDANTGQQLNTKNVAMISARHVDTWIPETEVGSGAKSIEIQIWGEGPATIFRDGQRFEGQWHRENPSDMLTFTDLEGNPLPLGQGNTWFELVPLGFDKLYVTS